MVKVGWDGGMSAIPALLKPRHFSHFVRVERTEDVGYIRSVINMPEMELSDGDELQVPLGETIFYLIPYAHRFGDGAVEDVPMGIMAFLPVNKVTWNPHIAILPEHRGNGVASLMSGLAWMFENTPCLKVVAYPPVFNTRMIHVFKKCGFTVEGRSVKSFLWRGEVHDRLLMGLEK